jgi:hypothetical protein
MQTTDVPAILVCTCNCWADETVVFRVCIAGAAILGLLLCCSCDRVARGTWPSPPRAPRPGTICADERTTVNESGARSGGADRREPRAIQQTMRSRYAQFRLCYEDALWRNREAAGRVQMRFIIANSGQVEGACVEQPALADGEMLECLIAELLALDFGTGSQVTVVYPILFVPTDSTATLR